MTSSFLMRTVKFASTRGRELKLHGGRNRYNGDAFAPTQGRELKGPCKCRIVTLGKSSPPHRGVSCSTQLQKQYADECSSPLTGRELKEHL